VIKSIVVARKKAGLSRAEFNKYWEKSHGPLAAKMIPGVRRYVQNHLVDVPGMEYDGDGVVEMWYDDVDAYLNSLKYLHSPEARELMEDGDKFADMRDARVWIVEEHVIL
jgi:uncharacterized protein (TIGR02118 family)